MVVASSPGVDNLLALRDATFEGAFPFSPHYLNINPDTTIHYVDEGHGHPIVMLHGDPTWGFLYRNFIPPFSEKYRCLVPDQMGMGKSSVPSTPFPYRLHHHIANFEQFVLELNLTNITLLLHDWGGPVGLGFGIRHSERIKRIILLNTWAFAPWPGGSLPKLFNMIRSNLGEKFVLRRNGYLKPALTGGVYKAENLTTQIFEAYQAPYPTPDSRLALLSWSRDIPLEPTDPSFKMMKSIEQGLPKFSNRPILIIWGMRDPVLSPYVLSLWQEVYPLASVSRIKNASHFLQEDAPETIINLINSFLKANP